MKHKLIILLIGSLLILSIFNFHSCRKDFEFKEFKNLKKDSLHLNGTVAVPLVNTELTLEKYIPKLDSTLWIETDNDGLLLIKMYLKDITSVKMTDVFPQSIFPLGEGFTIPKDSMNIQQTDATKLKLYDNLLSGKLFFNDPKIRFYITNGIPLATFFRIDTIKFYDENMDLLEHSNPIEYNILSPTIFGEIKETVVTIDKQSLPVLTEVFSTTPKSVEFQLTAGSHLDQTLPFDVTGEEKMNVDVEIELPLDLRLERIEMKDTFPMSWNSDTYNQIKEANLRVIFDNHFPIDVGVQVYFADSLGLIVDSLFETNQNLLSASSSETTNILINQERVSNLKEKKATQLILLGKLNTEDYENETFVKIKSTSVLGIKIGILAEYEGSSSDF